MAIPEVKFPAILMSLVLGCAGAADDAEPDPVGETSAPDAGTADASGSLDAGPAPPLTTCCRLDNERGERLDYKCGETGTAISAAWFEERGYRCWLVQ
jgi:hypothetical protein